jgi:AraC-like DNA-binding protein
VTLTLDSRDLDTRDAIPAIRSVVCDLVLPCDIEFDVAQPEYQLSLADIGKMQVFSISCSPNIVSRSARLARQDAEPAIFVHIPRSGSSGVVQHGREVTTNVGDAAIIDSAAPYELHFEQGMDQDYFRIPHSVLALPEKSITQLTATSLGQAPIGKFVVSYLQRLAASPDLLGAGPTALLDEPTIDLLRAALLTQLGDTKESRPALEATLELRIVDYMTRHLAEPDLTVKRIAFDHHISVRYLYVILARAGIAPGDWIRMRRMDACRHELMTPEAKNRSIALIASSWGFNDASRFSRSFQAAYGLSPQDWRQLSHQN